MSRYFSIKPATEKHTDGFQLSDEKLDDHILELVIQGNHIDACALLRERRGMSPTEAMQFIRELNDQSKKLSNYQVVVLVYCARKLHGCSILV